MDLSVALRVWFRRMVRSPLRGGQIRLGKRPSDRGLKATLAARRPVAPKSLDLVIKDAERDLEEFRLPL
jgi:hypothetical protein